MKKIVNICMEGEKATPPTTIATKMQVMKQQPTTNTKVERKEDGRKMV